MVRQKDYFMSNITSSLGHQILGTIGEFRRPRGCTTDDQRLRSCGESVPLQEQRLHVVWEFKRVAFRIRKANRFTLERTGTQSLRAKGIPLARPAFLLTGTLSASSGGPAEGASRQPL